jgi:hypothetical protein
MSWPLLISPEKSFPWLALNRYLGAARIIGPRYA